MILYTKMSYRGVQWRHYLAWTLFGMAADTDILLVPIGYRWWSLVSAHWTTNMEQFTSVNTLSTVSAVI